MSGTFSNPAKELLQQAREWARALQHEEAEPEHLLLALLSRPPADVRDVLQSCLPADESGRVPSPQQLAGRLRERISPGCTPVLRGKIPLSPLMRQVGETAARTAERLSGGTVEPLHLFLGLTQLQRGPAAQFLQQYGLTPEKLQARLTARTPPGENASGKNRAGKNVAAENSLSAESSPAEAESKPPAQETAALLAEADAARYSGTERPIISVVGESSGGTDREFPPDARLYLPRQEGWQAHIKRSWQKEYCYLKNPGEDYFHLLISGEIYLQRGEEKYCLNCALRHGILTRDRLYWQRLPERKHLRQFSAGERGNPPAEDAP